jgi:hypothetical protein
LRVPLLRLHHTAPLGQHAAGHASLTQFGVSVRFGLLGFVPAAGGLSGAPLQRC